MAITRWSTSKSHWLYPVQAKMEKLYSQQKQDRELTVAQIMNSLLPNSEWYWRKWGKPLDHSDKIRLDQSLSHVRLFATPWIAARQASLSITIYQSSHKLTSIQLVMPPSHLILCCPLFLLPPNPSQHQSLFQWVNSSHQVAKVLEGTFSFSIIPSKEIPGLISLQSKELSRVFSNTTVQKHQFFGAQLSSQSNSHIHKWPLEKP